MVLEKSKMRLLNTQKHLRKFLQGAGTDQSNHTIHEILSMDNKWWNSNHCFIQWVFPTGKRSRYNLFAPAVKSQISAPFMEESYQRFKTFLQNTEWQFPENHNCRRISRVLASLHLFGYRDLEEDFREYLRKTIIKYPGLENVRKYWNL